MSERVTFPSSAGEASGVLLLPDGDARGAGVVLIHEWWGVNQQIQSLGQRWADAGFVTIVPDLYHGTVAANADEAGAMMKALDFGRAVQEIAGAVTFLKGHERSTAQVAITGYCMGGALSLASAVNIRGLAAVVAYYGWPGPLDWKAIDAPIQAHFAKHDEWATVAHAEAVKAAVTVPMELYVYDAQHAFCNDRRPEVYDEVAANQAWERTLTFIRARTS
ncbi:MAG: dienelactone hydrolase family protein [Myxococcales bacterium]|nr:dienelactone hydrolase family protein [Myxococcales bacterium]